jgi:hypothetical protein
MFKNAQQKKKHKYTQFRFPHFILIDILQFTNQMAATIYRQDRAVNMASRSRGQVYDRADDIVGLSESTIGT